MLKSVLKSMFVLLGVAVWILVYSGNLYGQSSSTLSPWLSLFNNNRSGVLNNYNEFAKPKQRMLPTLQNQGNQLVPKPTETPSAGDIPPKYAESFLANYILESPDIITVEAVHLVPKSSYTLRTLDVIALDITRTPTGGTLIVGTFFVEPDGTVRLNEKYGSIQVKGLSLAEVEQAISQHLSRKNTENTQQQSDLNIAISAKLVRMSNVHQIANRHLIGPDGYITLGSFGRVYVNGLTIDECRKAIEFHLSKAFEDPQVTVDLYSGNSKEYYVIVQSTAMNKQVFAFPYTGNETVLKAIGNINGLHPNSPKRIWIVRPVENSHKPKILPVDWIAITAYGIPQTNYQLLAGDRVYIDESSGIVTDRKSDTSCVNKNSTARYRRDTILWKSPDRQRKMYRLLRRGGTP